MSSLKYMKQVPPDYRDVIDYFLAIDRDIRMLSKISNA